MCCSICGGALALLGVLGNLAHLRCIQCGSQCSAPAAEVLAMDDDDCLT